MAEHDSRKKSCPHTTVLHLGNADFEALVPSLVRRGASFLDFAARRLRPPIVISAVLLLLKALASAQSLRTQATQPLPPSPSPSPSPTLTLTFNPQMPSVQDTVPIGTVIATQSDEDVVHAVRRDHPNPVTLEAATGGALHVNWNQMAFVAEVLAIPTRTE